jgi:glycosyltransferase involved in cell wall biosynthesis
VHATRSGGVPELVEGGVRGRLVPRFDVEALTNVRRGMLADPESLRAMGQAARIRPNDFLRGSAALCDWKRSTYGSTPRPRRLQD